MLHRFKTSEQAADNFLIFFHQKTVFPGSSIAFLFTGPDKVAGHANSVQVPVSSFIFFKKTGDGHTA